MKPVEIQYISALCSDSLINQIFVTSKQKPRQEAQKFHRLLAEGFALHNKVCRIETLSLLPVTSSTHKKIIWKPSCEKAGNILFNYVPMINLPVVKDFSVFVYSFFRVLAWSLFKSKKEKAVICDSLKLSISGAALLACKISGVKVLGIVTDLPDLMVGHKKKFDIKYKLYKRLAYTVMSNFDKYILLTEAMNEVVNPNHRPFLIMEGLVDVSMEKRDITSVQKDTSRMLLYTGAIYKQYGIKTLLEAFMRLEDEGLRLHIYGPGDMENEMPAYMKRDNRIVYKGIVLNNEIADIQKKATLLINPRPTTEEFTKFSFPSKNMEYMVSGTPMVTTKLPGMPPEYYEYVFLFEDETVEGMADTLKNILLKSDAELSCLGSKAKQFVLNSKSNYIQAERILNFAAKKSYSSEFA